MRAVEFAFPVILLRKRNQPIRNTFSVRLPKCDNPILFSCLSFCLPRLPDHTELLLDPQNWATHPHLRCSILLEVFPRQAILTERELVWRHPALKVDVSRRTDPLCGDFCHRHSIDEVNLKPFPMCFTVRLPVAQLVVESPWERLMLDVVGPNGGRRHLGVFDLSALHTKGNVTHCNSSW